MRSPLRASRRNQPRRMPQFLPRHRIRSSRPSRRSSNGSTPFMSHAPTDLLSRRHTAIRQALAARGPDALAVQATPNILYLTTFKGSAAVVVLTADRLDFITDFRYVSAVEATRGTAWDCPGLNVIRVDTSYDETLAAVLARMPGARVGFEAANLTVSRHRWLGEKLQATSERAGPELVATEGLVEAARVRQDEYE